MSEASPLITIVDDDESLRRALARLLGAEGFRVRALGSARELLDEPDDLEPGCLLLDVRMPHLDGLTLQDILAAQGSQRAIVFMTGHGDVHASVRAMKAGAIDFLIKPFSDEELLQAINRALIQDAELRFVRRDREELRRRAATLTRREREVCLLVAKGMLNKQVAATIGTTEKTVKVHRARVMAKMMATSLADLVRIVDRLNGDLPRPGDVRLSHRLGPAQGEYFSDHPGSGSDEGRSWAAT